MIAYTPVTLQMISLQGTNLTDTRIQTTIGTTVTNTTSSG
jgi:hypothetical protein